MFFAFRRITSRFSLRTLSTKPSGFGQPTSASHPHLGSPLVGNLESWPDPFWIVNKDELTPGIPSLDYEERRRRLMNMLPDKSLVVLLAAPVKYMSASTWFALFV